MSPALVALWLGAWTLAGISLTGWIEGIEVERADSCPCWLLAEILVTFGSVASFLFFHRLTQSLWSAASPVRRRLVSIATAGWTVPVWLLIIVSIEWVADAALQFSITPYRRNGRNGIDYSVIFNVVLAVGAVWVSIAAAFVEDRLATRPAPRTGT